MVYRTAKIGVKKLKTAIKEISALDTQKYSIQDFQEKLFPILEDYIGQSFYIPTKDTPIICRARAGQYSNLKELMSPPPSLIKQLGRVNSENESVFYACCGTNAHLGSLDEIRVPDGTLVTQLFFRVKASLDTIIAVGYSKHWQSTETTENIKSLNISATEKKKQLLITNWLRNIFLQKVPPKSLHRYKLTIAIYRTLNILLPNNAFMFPSVSSQESTNITMTPEAASFHLEPVKARVVEVYYSEKMNGYLCRYVKESDSINLNTGEIDWKELTLFNQRDLKQLLNTQHMPSKSI